MIPTAVYGWGNVNDGQLGIGGVEEEQMYLPREVPLLNGLKIVDISTSFSHTLFLTEDGIIYSCGNNDYQQLGHDKPRKRPGRVDALETHVVTQVKCGIRHSVALTNQGQVFTWGSNEMKQLGRTASTLTSSPKLVKFPDASKSVVQISSGCNHVMALADDGSVYTWGANDCGQLGVWGAREIIHQGEPLLVASLAGLAVSCISSGANHNFVLTFSGALFGWGDNKFGQLGVGNLTNRSTPELCKMLRTQDVMYVCCGDSHTAILTQNGGVFTFGAGMFGQLGHGNTQMESNPKKIFELMGCEVSMIACGRNHTVVYVRSTEKLYTFGLGSNGQLGVNSRSNFHIPTQVQAVLTCQGSFVSSVHAGGDQTFVILSCDAKACPQRDFRRTPASQQIATITPEIVDKIHSCTVVSDDLQRKIKKVFSSLSCINGSFYKRGESISCSVNMHCVDTHASTQAFQLISTTACRLAKDLVDSSVEKHLLPEFPPKIMDWEVMRFFVLIPTSHYFLESKDYSDSIMFPLLRIIIKLDISDAGVLGKWWLSCGTDYLLHIVESLKAVIRNILDQNNASRPMERFIPTRQVLYSCLEVLKKINQMAESVHPPLDYNVFYMENIHELVSLELDYILWISRAATRIQIVQRESPMTPMNFESDIMPFCHYPFILDGQAKTVLLRICAMLQMREAVDEVQRHNIASLFLPMDPINPCFVLMVTRDNIVSDTISQLTKHQDLDFKKPLKVIFLGEEAMDAGGVKKEFFMLLLKDLLDPKYGMFKYYEESRLLWFNPDTFEYDSMYHLVGVVCGLAIYNNNIISMNLPLILFKKLLQKPATLEDLKELQPTVGRSLQQLLDHPGDNIEDTFNLSFEITREIYDQCVTIPLLPGGSEKIVTRDNRSEYVGAYVSYIFNEAVNMQFQAFSDGFLKVCGGRVLELFQPKELQAMVVGNENYDWDELEKRATYKDYSKDDLPIRLFWEVFKELSLEEKKKFLLFLTGCDRIPIHGMKAISLVIQPMGSSEELLPVAHTCFNILDLPRYSNKVTLRTKLLQAIEHTQGFGLV